MEPENLSYSREHEWLRMEGDAAVIGITAHAQEQLGDITFIEQPEPGREIKAGEAVAMVESVKAASDIYDPVAGTVTAVNEAREDTPEAVNQSPFGDGGICRI